MSFASTLVISIVMSLVSTMIIYEVMILSIYEFRFPKMNKIHVNVKNLKMPIHIVLINQHIRGDNS